MMKHGVREVEEIVSCLKTGTLTNDDLEMLTNQGRRAVLTRLRRLIGAGIVERITVTRIKDGQSMQVLTNQYRLTDAYLEGEVRFSPQAVARGLP